MTVRVLAIGTSVPDRRLRQETIRELLIDRVGTDRRTSRLVQAAFDASGIDTRHIAVAARGTDAARVLDARDPSHTPTTGERNAMYRTIAPAMFADAGRAALTAAGVRPDEVTHVVTVSCTGSFAPGPDFRLMRDLDLPATAQRYHLGFMGCAAAMPALRLAHDICRAQPDATVLVACAEVCSLHARWSSVPEQIVSAAIFADGAAAAVVSARPPRAGTTALDILAFHTSTADEGAADMDWTIGDHGFELRLSAQVPLIVGKVVQPAMRELLSKDQTSAHDVVGWAVHPGGRSILDRVQAALDLDDTAMSHSRDILREYGNMSSATVLFILRRLIDDASITADGRIAALCFGPGLTVEAGLFSRVDAAARDAAARDVAEAR